MNENDIQNQQDDTLGEVVINLNTLDSTKVLKEEELIFHEECRRMVEKIQEKLNNNRDKFDTKGILTSSNLDTDGAANCFFIDGPRGSGKSTLLRAIRHILVNGDTAHKAEQHIRLFSLADIDPTELGKGENFFIYILCKVYDLLQNANIQSNGDDSMLDKIRRSLETIRNMSSGLQMLMDSEEVLKKNDTPEFFLENCLDKCSDSTKMRQKLSDLIDILSEIVHSQAFLITIDDADLNFSQCENVLEYIRKYMHNPRLIFLFAGDMQLYSHVVRGMQLKNFHQNQLSHDKSHESSRIHLLNCMEDQYLLKTFPVDNRVHISALKTILGDKRQISITTGKNGLDKSDIQSALTSLLKFKADNNIIDTILQLPLRSVLSLLRYLAKNPHNDEPSKAALYSWKGVQDVFHQSLMHYNIDYEQIGTNDIRVLQKNILEYHAKAGIWYGDLSLQPTEGDEHTKQVALYLGGAVCQATMSLSAKIKYWCACFPLWQRVREKYIYSSYEMDAKDFLDSCLQLTNARHRSSWANLACAAVAPNIDEPLLFNQGVICLLNDDCAQDNEIGQDERKGFKSLAKTIFNQEVFENDDEKLAIAAINSCLCRIDSTDNSYYYISIYHLLMNIAEWLDFAYDKFMYRARPAAPEKGPHDIKEIKKEIHSRITKETAANQTLRISDASRRNRYLAGARASRLTERTIDDTTELLVQRITHTYKCHASAKIVDKMFNWLNKYVTCSYASSAAEFTYAWEVFQGACSRYSLDGASEYDEIISSPNASTILKNYMKAVEQAAGAFSPEFGLSLHECITSFPLWEALKAALDHPSNLKKLLDKARIGRFVNTKIKEKFHQYKIQYENLKEKVSNLEMDNEKAQSKLSAAQKELEETQKRLSEMEGKYKRNNGTLIQHIEEQRKIESLGRSLFGEEIKLDQEILNFKNQESETMHQLSQIQQDIDNIETIKNGESTGFPEYSIMIENLQLHVRLKYKTKRESVKQAHQATIDSIKKEINMLQLREKKKLPKDAYTQALENKRKCQENLSELKAIISTKTAQKTTNRRERIMKDRELSIIKERVDELYKLEYKSRIDFETAKLKYSIAQKFANEAKNLANTTVTALEKGKEMSNKAKDAYINFKTFKPDE